MTNLFDSCYLSCTLNKRKANDWTELSFFSHAFKPLFFAQIDMLAWFIIVYG